MSVSSAIGVAAPALSVGHAFQGTANNIPKNPSAQRSQQWKAPSFDAPASKNDELKGELSGDDCFTVDISSHSEVRSSVWDEVKAVCTEGKVLKTPLHIDKIGSVISSSDDPASGFSPIELLSEQSKKKSSGLKILSQFLLSYAALRPTVTDEQSSDKSAKKKKNKSIKKSSSLTMVVRSCVTTAELAVVSKIASDSSFQLRNIFRRGLSVVAYNLTCQPNFLSALIKATQVSSVCPDPTVLYIYVSQEIGRKAFTMEVELVRCESSVSVKESSKMAGLFFDRIVTASVLERTYNISINASDVSEVISVLASRGDISKSSIAAVILSMPDRECLSVEYILAELSHLGSLNVFHSSNCEPASGACLLSAAELSSSKLYTQNTEGSWKLIFQLPFADGFASDDIGVRIEGSKQHDSSEMKVLCVAGTRLERNDVGPLRKKTSTLYPVAFSALFSFGPIYWPWKKREIESSKLTVWWRNGFTGTVTDEWKLLRELEPLALNTSNGQDTLHVTNSKVDVIVDARTGGVLIDVKRDETVKDRLARHWIWIKLSISIILLFLIVMLFLYSSTISEYFLRVQHERWLREFYEVNAPNKLISDPEIVKRTVRKYHDKIFVLWRQLEKHYRVKWKPPQSIVDTDL